MNDGAAHALRDWLMPRQGGARAYQRLAAAIRKGDIGDAGGIGDWVLASLTGGDIRNDAILLALAYRCETDAELAELAAFSIAAYDGADIQAETMLRGLGFSDLTREAWGIDLPDMAYPIAVGFTSNLMAVPLDKALATFLAAELDHIRAVAAECGIPDNAYLNVEAAFGDGVTSAMGAGLGDLTLPSGTRAAPAVALAD